MVVGLGTLQRDTFNVPASHLQKIHRVPASPSRIDSLSTSVAALCLLLSAAPVSAQSGELAPAKEWEFGAIDEQFLRSISDRESVGIGLSPFGGAASYAVGHAVTLHADVTAGGVLFTNVVPYGKATRANFTVAPTPGVRWEPHNSMRIGTGYKLHHLSNASLGSTNPGMNSHIWYLSVGVVR